MGWSTHGTPNIDRQAKRLRRRAPGAFEALLAGLSPRVVEDLCYRLADPDPTVRTAMCAALSFVGDARAVGPLTVALRDNDQNVMKAAAAALGWLGDSSAVPILREILASHPKVAVRKAAVSTLGQIACAESIDALEPALMDESQDVRDRATSALAQLVRMPSLERFSSALPESRLPTRSFTLPDGEPAFSLEDVCRHVEKRTTEGETFDDEEDWGLVWAAEYFGGDGSIAILKTLFEKGGCGTDHFAAEALGRAGVPDAIAPLVEALRASDHGRWQTAARGLRGGQCDEALELLVPRLKAPEYISRHYAAGCLIELDDARAVPALIEALQGEDMQGVAAEALGKLGSHLAYAPLLEAYKTAQDLDKPAIALALGRLGDATYVPVLIRELQSSDSEFIRKTIAEVLGDLRDVRAIEALLAALSDPDWQVRGESATALGKLKNIRAWKPLVHCYCTDPKPWTRLMAERALHELPPLQIR